MRLVIELDVETAGVLASEAVRHLRTVSGHAYALLREALGLPVPWPVEEEAAKGGPTPERQAAGGER